MSITPILIFLTSTLSLSIYEDHVYYIRLAGIDEYYVTELDNYIYLVSGSHLDNFNNTRAQIISATEDGYKIIYNGKYLSAHNLCKGIAVSENVDEDTTLWEFHQSKNGYKLFNRCKNYYISDVRVFGNDHKTIECKQFEVVNAPMVFNFIDVGLGVNFMPIDNVNMCIEHGYVMLENEPEICLHNERDIMCRSRDRNVECRRSFALEDDHEGRNGVLNVEHIPVILPEDYVVPDYLITKGYYKHRDGIVPKNVGTESVHAEHSHSTLEPNHYKESINSIVLDHNNLPFEHEPDHYEDNQNVLHRTTINTMLEPNHYKESINPIVSNPVNLPFEHEPIHYEENNNQIVSNPTILKSTPELSTHKVNLNPTVFNPNTLAPPYKSFQNNGNAYSIVSGLNTQPSMLKPINLKSDNLIKTEATPPHQIPKTLPYEVDTIHTIPETLSQPLTIEQNNLNDNNAIIFKPIIQSPTLLPEIVDNNQLIVSDATFQPNSLGTHPHEVQTNPIVSEPLVKPFKLEPIYYKDDNDLIEKIPEIQKPTLEPIYSKDIITQSISIPLKSPNVLKTLPDEVLVKPIISESVAQPSKIEPIYSENINQIFSDTDNQISIIEPAYSRDIIYHPDSSNITLSPVLETSQHEDNINPIVSEPIVHAHKHKSKHHIKKIRPAVSKSKTLPPPFKPIFYNTNKDPIVTNTSPTPEPIHAVENNSLTVTNPDPLSSTDEPIDNTNNVCPVLSEPKCSEIMYYPIIINNVPVTIDYFITLNTFSDLYYYHNWLLDNLYKDALKSFKFESGTNKTNHRTNK